MAKGFAEQSGGGLAIDSVPGAGTTVTLWLRQALGDIVHKRADDVPSCIASAAARLLLVDDDDLVRETLTARLEDLGLAVWSLAMGPRRWPSWRPGRWWTRW